MVPTGLVLALTVVAANELADALAHKGPALKDPAPYESGRPRQRLRPRIRNPPDQAQSSTSAS